MALVLGLLLCFVSKSLAGHLVYTDCNSSPEKIVHIDHALLSADPVHIPGPESGSVDVHILKPIAGKHFKVDVTIRKRLGILGFTRIPCINGIGSCTYELCDVLSGKQFDGVNHCPLEIKQSSPDFNCACPFQPGDYHLNKTTFMIPELAGLWSWLAGGDYKAHVAVTDTNVNKQVACYDFQISTETDCVGIACLIG